MRLRSLLLASAVVASVACTDTSRSPVGEDLLPGGVLQGELEVVVLDQWSFSADYEVFPSGRAEADRLVGAVEWPEPPGFESRPIVRFSLAELDSIPEGAEILSLNLKLVYSSLPSRPVSYSVHRLTSSWNEEAATWTRRDFGLDWSQPGGDLDPVPLLEFTLQAADAPADSVGAIDSIAVPFPRQLVEDWGDGTVPNHGIVLVQKTAGEEVEFAARGDGGGNLNAPRLEFEIQIGEAGSPVSLVALSAEEDTFLAIDRGGGTVGPLLDVGAGAQVLRTILTPSIEQVPAGATVAEAKLVVSLDRAVVPGDSLRFVAREVFGEFRGEKTVLSPITSTTILGIAVLKRDSLPADSLVFESTRLRTLVRRWIRDPETISPLAITVLDEEFSFGSASLFTPQAVAPLRPRLRLLVLPPAEGAVP